jgi:hypothetical protein
MASPGVVGNPNWKPGVSGNPNGRPRTKPTPLVNSKVTREIFEEAAKRGYTHPVIYMLEVMHDPNVSDQRRDTMAACAAPWMTPKYGKDERFVDEAFQVPTTASAEEAQRFLDELPMRVRNGEIDFQSATEFSILIARALQERRAVTELELKLLASNQSTGPQVVKIEGGLPTAPGHEGIIMPTGNGHVILEHEPTHLVTNGSSAATPATESVPEDPRDTCAGPPQPTDSNP